jgi:ribonuclease D
VRFTEGETYPPKVTEVIEVTGIEEITEAETTPQSLATTQDQVESIVYKIQSAELISVDLETTGLNPRIDRIRLISLATTEGTWLIDCFEVDPHPLFEILAHKKLIMHNGAFDLGFLFARGFELKDGAEVMDTMLMSQILEDKEIA